MKTDKKTEPATHLDEVDALRLENLMMKAQTAETHATSLRAKFNDACADASKRYGFNLETDSVNFDTRAIVRK